MDNGSNSYIEQTVNFVEQDGNNIHNSREDIQPVFSGVVYSLCVCVCIIIAGIRCVQSFAGSGAS